MWLLDLNDDNVYDVLTAPHLLSPQGTTIREAF